MPTVDVRQDDLRWPARCCRCASVHVETRPHTEKTMHLGASGLSRPVTIRLDVPLCRRCAGAHLPWFGLAAVFGIIAWLPLSGSPASHALTRQVLALMVAAIACGLIGARRKPVQVLHVDEASGTIRLKVFNDTVAAELRRHALPAH